MPGRELIYSSCRRARRYLLIHHRLLDKNSFVLGEFRLPQNSQKSRASCSGHIPQCFMQFCFSGKLQNSGKVLTLPSKTQAETKLCCGGVRIPCRETKAAQCPPYHVAETLFSHKTKGGSKKPELKAVIRHIQVSNKAHHFIRLRDC